MARAVFLSAALFLCHPPLAASQPAGAARPAAGRARHALTVPTATIGPSTGVILNADDAALYEALPVLTSATTVAYDAVFANPAPALTPPDNVFPLPPQSATACRLGAAVPSCGGNLSVCLAGAAPADISTPATYCGCYTAHAACFAAAGCIDALPQADRDYCFGVLRCSQAACTLSGARGRAAGALALAAALAAAIALARAPHG